MTGTANGNGTSQETKAVSPVLAVRMVDRAILRVTGADRLAWLNGLLTADLMKSREGTLTYGLFVGRSGRVLADAVAVADGPALFVLVPASRKASLQDHLEHYLVMEDVEVAPADDVRSVWELHGPRSAEVLAAAREAGAFGGALDRTGLGGALVLTHPEAAAEVERALLTSVASVGGAIGDAASWKTLRLERAVAEFGVDFDEKTYPQEAALERVAVSFDKGCYLGQEVVCMLELRGHVKRKLASIVLEGEAVPPPGAEVRGENAEKVGEVTSASWSPRFRRVVGLAMLKRGTTLPGTAVVVGEQRGQVVVRPD